MWRVSAVAAVLGSLAVSGAAQPQLVIRDRRSPTNMVRLVAGSCGANRFAIALRHEGAGNVLGVEVNGAAVSASELAKVMRSVQPGYVLFEPSIVECFWDSPNARMRILTAGPATPGSRQDLSFEVSPSGAVSNVRPD
jgi:hypothetical protein